MDGPDEAYEAFLAKWKPRLGLKTEHLTLGYLRGLGQAEGSLTSNPDRASVHVRVDGRGLDADLDPNDIDAFVSDWAAELAGEVRPREITKRFICETVLLYMHLGPRGPKVVGASLWLASANEGALDALKEPGGALVLEFSFEDDGVLRMKCRVIDRAG